MVKGVQKRMVEVKLKNNRLYEGAYLVVRTQTHAQSVCEREILDEANRIISAWDIEKNTGAAKHASANKIISGALLLLLGMVVGFAIGVLI